MTVRHLGKTVGGIVFLVGLIVYGIAVDNGKVAIIGGLCLVAVIIVIVLEIIGGKKKKGS